MHLGFIRHGETSWNALGKIQGQTDIPLNEQGLLQAKLLANRLKHDQHRWDAVISSDMMRASETAAIIAQTLHIPLLESDTRLRERSFGLAEGTTAEERLERWGELWRTNNLVHFEQEEQISARVRSFIADVEQFSLYRNLLVVSHGSLLAVMFRELCRNLENKRIGNVSYSIFHRQDGQWKAELHNCTKHLEQVSQ